MNACRYLIFISLLLIICTVWYKHWLFMYINTFLEYINLFQNQSYNILVYCVICCGSNVYRVGHAAISSILHYEYYCQYFEMMAVILVVEKKYWWIDGRYWRISRFLEVIILEFLILPSVSSSDGEDWQYYWWVSAVISINDSFTFSCPDCTRWNITLKEFTVKENTVEHLEENSENMRKIVNFYTILLNCMKLCRHCRIHADQRLWIKLNEIIHLWNV